MTKWTGKAPLFLHWLFQWIMRSGIIFGSRYSTDHQASGNNEPGGKNRQFGEKLRHTFNLSLRNLPSGSLFNSHPIQ